MMQSPSGRFFSGCRQRHFSCGQASIEYLVILAFSVIILLRPFSYNDNGTTPEAPALKQLANAIKDYHKGYTAAMAIASIPECEFSKSYDISSMPSVITNEFGNTLTAAADICVDWSKPEIPGVSINGLSLGDFTGSIEDIIKNTVEGAVDGFLHPDFGSLLGFSNPF